MKKTVNFCGNCPFVFSEYDDFAVGDSTVEICTLARFLNKEHDIISTHNNDDSFIYDEEPPKWCPLKEQKLELEYKKYSEKRLNRIKKAKEKILDLFNEIDNEENIEENDERFDKLNELNLQLDKLYNSEELNLENFADELNNSVKEINEQINLIMEESTKLGETLNNLDDEEDTDKE